MWSSSVICEMGAASISQEAGSLIRGRARHAPRERSDPGTAVTSTSPLARVTTVCGRTLFAMDLSRVAAIGGIRAAFLHCSQANGSSYTSQVVDTLGSVV